MDPVLSINNLSKKYYNKIALENINLNFEKGKIYGLIGPNGSGKTTLMKVIAGLHKESSGKILINNKPASYKTKENISFMPTDDFLYDSFKVKQILKYYSDMYNDFDYENASKVLEDIGVDSGFKVSKLSSGLKGKLKVTLALSRNADIYMLDEPLNSVDVLSRDTIMDLIVNAYADHKTFIISSHLVSETEKVFDYVVFLKNGFVELSGEAEDLRQKNGMSIENLYKEVYR